MEKKEKKIGIITLQNSNNLGAFLQQYALEKLIRSLGYEVKIINYKSLRYTILEFFSMMIIDPLSQFRSLWSSNNDYLSLDKRFYFINKKIFEGFNTIIYGSDEIWNLQRISLGKDLFYFGKTLQNKEINKISYAASFGHTEDISISDKNLLLSLKDFNYLSVRDTNSQTILETHLGRTVPIHLDPVLLYDFKKEIRDNALINLDNYKNQILIYGKINDQNVIKKIKKFSIENKKNIISVGFYNSWAKKNLLSINPFQFLNLIRLSDYIFTNMFHGLQFCLMFRKKIFLIRNDEKYHKLSFLVNLLKITYADENKCFTENIVNNLDNASLITKLETLRKDSLKYLIEKIS